MHADASQWGLSPVFWCAVRLPVAALLRLPQVPSCSGTGAPSHARPALCPQAAHIRSRPFRGVPLGDPAGSRRRAVRTGRRHRRAGRPDRVRWSAAYAGGIGTKPLSLPSILTCGCYSCGCWCDDGDGGDGGCGCGSRQLIGCAVAVHNHHHHYRHCHTTLFTAAVDDGTGTITCTHWLTSTPVAEDVDVPAEAFAQSTQPYALGDLVVISGRLRTFRGRNQITISTIRTYSSRVARGRRNRWSLCS